MNEDVTRGEAMKLAKYSDKASEHPARVEQSEGFKYAMLEVAGMTGKSYTKVLAEIEVRDLSKESTDTLLKAVDTLSKAWERFIPKQAAQQDSNLSSIFDNVIDITPGAEQAGLDNKEDMLPSDTPQIVDDVNAIVDNTL